MRIRDNIHKSLEHKKSHELKMSELKITENLLRHLMKLQSEARLKRLHMQKLILFRE